jgi:hypothetical protein
MGRQTLLNYMSQVILSTFKAENEHNGQRAPEENAC